jgi:antitoxin MazE
MESKTVTLSVQKWGNSLAVRIPVVIARGAHLHSGTIVELDLVNGNIVVKPMGQRKLTLDERLQAFDPSRHSGEAMATTLIGAEKFE